MEVETQPRPAAFVSIDQARDLREQPRELTERILRLCLLLPVREPPDLRHAGLQRRPRLRGGHALSRGGRELAEERVPQIVVLGFGQDEASFRVEPGPTSRLRQLSLLLSPPWQCPPP